MKKFQLLSLALLLGSMSLMAEENLVILDLTKATDAPLQFNEETGSWTGTFDDDAEVIESQSFLFLHNSMADYDTWWGFTASNSADNSARTDYLTYQFSNMAKGGIQLDAEGNIMKDEYGDPVVSAEVPYIVAYYNAYMSARPCDIIFNDGKAHEAVGVYVNLNSYAYYTVEIGNGFSRPFHNSDNFTLTVHGIAEDETEKTVEVNLASMANGNLTINRSWSYVDLTSLGKVTELYFTMASTDSGTWGMNTPGYFCLDKLMVRAADDVAVTEIGADESISYDRESKTLSLGADSFAVVYDAAGNKVLAAEGPSISVSGLERGVYVAKAGNATLKFIR